MADTKLTDLAEATSMADGDWLYAVVSNNARKIQKGNLGVGATKVLASADPSAAAQVDFALPSGFDRFRLVGYVLPATDSVSLLLRLSNDGGSTFENGASAYSWLDEFHNMSAGTETLANSAGDTEIPVHQGAMGNAAGEGIHFEIDIIRPGDSSARTAVFTRCIWRNPSNNPRASNTRAFREVSEANDAVRLLFNSGNIAEGHVTLIGIKGS